MYNMSHIMWETKYIIQLSLCQVSSHKLLMPGKDYVCMKALILKELSKFGHFCLTEQFVCCGSKHGQVEGKSYPCKSA